MKGGSLFHNSPSTTPPHNSRSPTSTPPPSHRHTFSNTIMEENLEKASSIISKWDLDSHKHENFSPLFTTDRAEAMGFLESVTSLRKAMHHYINMNSNSAQLIRAKHLMEIAMKRLEKEFYARLCSNRNSESVSGQFSRVSISSRASESHESDEVSEDEEDISFQVSDMSVDDSQMIATCMIECGYGKECVNIYKIVRKSIIDETLYYLGMLEKLNFSQMQKMEWDVLDRKIQNWLYGFKIAVKTLFQGERILCDLIFSSSEHIATSCFTELSREAAINLFSFPENVAKSKKIHSPEKIFRALDLHDGISDLWSEIESIFSYDSLSAVRSEAIAAKSKLGEAVRAMLNQFEDAIQKDISKVPIGGGVHPLTRYVMNFLVFIGDYSGAVSEILSDSPVKTLSPMPESFFLSPTAGGGADPSAIAITDRLAWLILVLLCKLDGKATQYNDVALSYLFLANNLNYVVSKVRSSCLGILMGPEWLWTNGAKVKRYMANYERMGWSLVVGSLPENPTADITPEQARECFRKFNLSFEDAYKKQSSWVIPDAKLRDEVKVSLAKVIGSGYRALYLKHRGAFVSGMEPVVRYSPEDLGNYLSDLFFAVVVPSASSKSSSHESSSGWSRAH